MVATAPVVGTVPTGRQHFTGALRAEWTKLRSVRSTLWCVAAAVVGGIGIGILATSSEASTWRNAGIIEVALFDPTSISLTGLLFGQLAIGVLGVLTMSAEYGTGTIRATLGAVPRRPVVLLAKVVVFGTLALAVSEAISFAAFFIGQAILTGSAPHAALGQPGVLRAVAGGGLYLGALGLLALGLAAMVRHTAGAITTFVGILLILPLILAALPSFIRDAAGKYLPANIGAVMTSVRPSLRSAEFPSFAPWTGLAILGGYAVAALVIGGWLFTRRDA